MSGAARELALDMNRIVIANERTVSADGEPDVDGASGLDAASRVHEIAIPAIVACEPVPGWTTSAREIGCDRGSGVAARGSSPTAQAAGAAGRRRPDANTGDAAAGRDRRAS